MKDIDYYKTCSNTRIQQDKTKTLLKKNLRKDYLEYDLQLLAEAITYCCKNYNSKISCQCKNLQECETFNKLILKYADLLKEYKKGNFNE